MALKVNKGARQRMQEENGRHTFVSDLAGLSPGMHLCVHTRHKHMAFDCFRQGLSMLSGCPGIYYVDQASLGLKVSHLSAYPELGLKACTDTSNLQVCLFVLKR